MTNPVVGYVGMTHLGLCSAVAAASKGFRTRAIDRDATLIAQINGGKLPVVEPDLDDLLAANRARIEFSSDGPDLRICDLVYVAPDVPTDDAGKGDLAGLDQLLEFTLANTRADTVVVVLSQVPPGRGNSRGGSCSIRSRRSYSAVLLNAQPSRNDSSSAARIRACLCRALSRRI